jgi:hypothetical protein
MKGLSSIFSVSNAIPEAVSLTLSVQIGKNSVCYALTGSSDNALYQIRFFKFLEWTEEITEALDEEFRPYIAAVQHSKLSFFDDEFILTDVSQHNSELPELLFKAQYPKRSASQLWTDSILNWQIYQSVPVNTIAMNWSKKLPNTRYFSPLKITLSNLQSVNIDGKLLVDVGLTSFNVVLIKSNRLLLCQSYSYSNAADVLYYLQSIVTQFDLNNTTVELDITGLVDTNSPLYKDLYQYFLKINLREAKWVDQLGEVPLHYFTNLNELSTCEL